MNKAYKIVSTTVALVLLSTKVYAMSGGYNVDLADAKTVGTGGGGFAKADSPATNWYNPAGLTKLKNDAYTITLANISAKNHLTTPTDEKIDSRPTKVTIPALHYKQSLNEKVAFGLSFTATYGSGTEWDDVITKYVSTKTCLKIHNLNPNLAYALNDQISIAAGLDISYATGNMKKIINQSILNAGIMRALTGVTALNPYTDAYSELDGSGNSLGTNLALLYTPNETINIGLAYRSPIDIDLSGKVYMRGLNGPAAGLFGGQEYQTQALLKLSTPATFGAGITYKFSEQTTGLLNIEWAKWSRMKNMHIRYRTETDPSRLAILNANNPIEKDYKDTVNYGIGIEHQLNDKYAIFAGAGYKPSPTPEKSFDTLLVPLDLFSINTGGTINFAKSSLDINLTYAWGKKTNINNEVGNTSGASIDGDYKKDVLILVLSYTRKL